MSNNYRNPFIAYNTNGMPSEEISELFTDPYTVLNKTRQDIINDKSSIVFIGSRGTGKTMILKQFSYNVQRVALNEYSSYLQKVKEENFIGVYFRVDNALIKSLDVISDYNDNIPLFSENLFIHYLELTVFKDLLEVIKIFINEAKIDEGCEDYNSTISEIASLITSAECKSFTNIDEIITYIVEQINYIWNYQSKKAIDILGTVKFEPDCGLILQGRLTNELLKKDVFTAFGLSDINVLLLIDEFENFSEKQQRVLNTSMRFSKEHGLRYRIGMRPYGYKTHGTVSNDDFVKEGRDYQKIELDFYYVDKKNMSSYGDFVRKIANKRLSKVSQFVGKDIEFILGKSANLEEEAREIVKGRDKHVIEYLKLINQERKKNKKMEISTNDFEPLRDENPLFEMENLILLLRGRELEYVKQAFSDYKIGKKSDPQKKYSLDYNNKYKLSFVFVLCTIYRTERKKYYGFKDYCQMSSGIVSHFIELCRRAFEIAFFKDQGALLTIGKISSLIQTEAAYDISQKEHEMIKHINEHGKPLDVFIRNIGNAFGHIHKDLRIKYPETNLFPISDKLSEENNRLVEIACMWSLIIKKPIMQDASASGEKRDIYFINRIFSPSFKISHRTRGGLNPITVDDIYFSTDFDIDKIFSVKKKNKNTVNAAQLTLFTAQAADAYQPQSLEDTYNEDTIMINIDTQEDI